jgi:hypothetical protein
VLTLVPSRNSIASIQNRIAPLQAQLAAHPIYEAVRDLGALRVFMQSHVFAVWDFMSLLKALQRGLTCVEVPWVPTPLASSRRFVNEIVLGEESDEFHGRAVSHFELYLEAMEQAGADTTPMKAVLHILRENPNATMSHVLKLAPKPAREFARETFRVIEHGSLAAQAAAFTFGREDVIPDLFRGFVRELNGETSGALSTFVWYLERHIEVDGEDHGPLSLRMVADLCGSSPELWAEASDAAESAIRARLALWDGILAQITEMKSVVVN